MWAASLCSAAHPAAHRASRSAGERGPAPGTRTRGSRLIPDYSFELYFRQAGRAPLLLALGHLCAVRNAGTGDLGAALESDSGLGVTLAFRSDSDAALVLWRQRNPDLHDLARVPAHEFWIGSIQLWLKKAPPLRHDPKHAESICLTLWPTSSAMQMACLDSPTVRGELVRLLIECEGVAGYIDRGDGSVAEFWPIDAAPPGYEQEWAGTC
jgi:hypothetical protein